MQIARRPTSAISSKLSLKVPKRLNCSFKYPKPVMLIVKGDVCWATYTPVSAEYEIDQLRKLARNVWQEVQLSTYNCIMRLYIRWRALFKVQLCLLARI